MYAIETFALSKSYEGNQLALDNSSYAIKQGEIFGFLGPNGSGKTTSVRLLNGILTPTSGRASILGMDVVVNQTEIHKQCGVMTETALMYENLSGLENLYFFGRMHSMKDSEIAAKSKELLNTLELTDAKDKKVKAYSTGMKRRISLARALLHSPKVLFLDEPTSGLDPEAAMNVTRLVRNLSIEHGVTVFLCTHQLKYAEEICTLYGFIDKGKMLGIGTFHELLEQKNGSMYIELRGDNLPKLPFSEVLEDARVRIPIRKDEDAYRIIKEVIAGGGQVYEAKQVQWSLEDLYFEFQKGARA